ncbi:MAG TPA: alpha/beta fold hydrolase [Opitutaceae bacterium]|nr:alpha/beta fold hydrolase [Opitutaceae bacterium]
MKPKRAFIIHGYQGYPGEAWQPWLKAELEQRGWAVWLPAMPRPDHPVMAEWIGLLAALVGEPDEQTVLVGHSLGVQVVLRYLEQLAGRGRAVGKIVLIAGAFPAGMSAEEADRRTGGDAALRPWLTLGVDGEKVNRAAGRITVILSDNDPIIPYAQARDSFARNLRCEILVEPGKGHFNEDDHLTDLPVALRAVLD